MVQEQIAAGGQVAGVTREQRWVLGLASLASFIVILDVMVVATALTAIRRHLGASLADLEWTVNAYTLSFAVLLMTAAALGDRLGRRRVFAAGLIIFAVSSAGCALAPDAAALIAARAVQGAGAATIMPMALALLNGAFPPARRGWAIGIYGGVTALAAVAGPVLGGAVTQGLGWQWIFWLNVPVALAAVPLVLSRISEATGPGAAVDLPGLMLVTTAALGLVWGLVRGNTAGWGSLEVIGTLAGGTAAAAAFAAWERRAACPMIPGRLFRSPAFSAGNTAIFMINASLTGVIFLMPQFQQVVAGQDPLGSGLRLLPWGIAPFLVGPRAGALADRVGERVLVVTGSLLQAAGVAWIAAAAGPGTGYLALVAPMIYHRSRVRASHPGRHQVGHQHRAARRHRHGIRRVHHDAPARWRVRCRGPRRRVRRDRKLRHPRSLQPRVHHGLRRRGGSRPRRDRGRHHPYGPREPPITDGVGRAWQRGQRQRDSLGATKRLAHGRCCGLPRVQSDAGLEQAAPDDHSAQYDDLCNVRQPYHSLKHAAPLASRRRRRLFPP